MPSVIDLIPVFHQFSGNRRKEEIQMGTAFNSRTILADAGCKRIRLILSAVLLAASFIYELTGFGWAGLYFHGMAVFTEGREAFEKASNIKGLGCRCGN